MTRTQYKTNVSVPSFIKLNIQLKKKFKFFIIKKMNEYQKNPVVNNITKNH